jgi:hypothetical protein
MTYRYVVVSMLSTKISIPPRTKTLRCWILSRGSTVIGNYECANVSRLETIKRESHYEGYCSTYIGWLVTEWLPLHVGIEEARQISYDLPPMAHPPEPFNNGSHFLVYRLFSLDRTSLEFRLYYQERCSRFSFHPPTLLLSRIPS